MNILKKILAMGCIASLLITTPAVTVLASEEQQNISVTDVENPGIVSEEETTLIVDQAYDDVVVPVGASVDGMTSGFSDVQDPSHPYYKAICWAVQDGVTKGYKDGTFGIDRPCTRGEMIMFLWRFAGKPASQMVSKSPFKDVSKNHTFYKAILWAYQSGVTKGYKDGTFGINRNVGRGDCMMFLWRVSGKPAAEMSSKSPFADVSKTHPYYKAILWGAQTGITKGYTSGPKAGLFGIDDNCTRGQIMTFIYRDKSELTSDDVDTDNDGLVDADELYYKTNPLNPDTDGDGLSDLEEILLGTDPLTVNTYDDTIDTDDDGLLDIDEASKYYTDPYSVDTDRDGLSDYDEIFTYGTDPVNPDTDGDTLSDLFEIDHGLNPNAASTDGIHDDGALEIDQELPETSISAVLTASDNVVKPHIGGNFAGELSDKVFLGTSFDTAATDNRAIVGKPVLVDGNDADINGLTLSFDLSGYEGDTASLIIVSSDEDGSYTPVESDLSGTTLSAVLTTGGTYMVLNAAEFLSSLGIENVEDFIVESTSGEYYDVVGNDANANANAIIHEENVIEEEVVGSARAQADDVPAEDPFAETPAESPDENYDEETLEITGYPAEVDEVLLAELDGINSNLVSADVSGQADIVFAIDTTGSMSSAINNVVTNVTSFANTLSENYNVKVNYALIDFKDIEEDGPDTTITVKNGHTNWYSNVNSFTAKVRTLYATGGGDTPECDIDALETARRLDWRKNSSKFIILITDTYFKNANNYGLSSMEEEIELLAKNGITTSVVTTSSARGVYESLYNTTGGIYANIGSSSFSSSLLALADLIGKNTSDGTWVILKHGYRYVKLTDEEDQDGDGLSTAYELGEERTVDLSAFIRLMLMQKGIPESEYAGKKTIIVYDAKSDPTLADSDSDGICDNKDTAPWAKGLKGGVVGTMQVCSSADGYATPIPFWNTGSHGWLVYKTYVNDSIGFNTGLYATMTDEELYYSDISDIPVKHDEVITIGTWGNKDRKGMYVNLELIIGSKNYEDYYSLCHSVTATQLEKLCTYTQNNDKWTETQNCSYYASNAWNAMFDDNLSAKQFSPLGWVCTPNHLANNIKKRDGYLKNEPFGSDKVGSGAHSSSSSS